MRTQYGIAMKLSFTGTYPARTIIGQNLPVRAGLVPDAGNLAAAIKGHKGLPCAIFANHHTAIAARFSTSGLNDTPINRTN